MVEKLRKAPSITSTNAAHVRLPFDGQAVKYLSIPRFIDDYNQYIGGVDVANRLRASYELHRPTRRTWWPIFYWLLDASLVNAYRLTVVYGQQMALKPYTQYQFRKILVRALLKRSVAVQIAKLNSTLAGTRLFGAGTSAHRWGIRGKRADCATCAYRLKRARIEGQIGGRRRIP
jgi:hypothetical protein